MDDTVIGMNRLAAGLKRAAALCAIAWLANACALSRAEGAGLLELAWLDAQGQVHSAVLDAQGRPFADPAGGKASGITPGAVIKLGSLWKLVAYAQWVESGAPDQPMQCTGRSREEVYCCQRNERIERATALMRSCGLYFANERVPWHMPAGPVMQALPPALVQAVRAKSLGPETQLPLQEWLQWLGAWPGALREQASNDLLGYWLAGPGKAALAQLAGQLRVKTWTVELAKGRRRAGASGWTAQGVALWFGAAGTSADVVPARAQHVLDAMHALAWPSSLAAQSDGVSCVRVHFFARYPLREITEARSGKAVASGVLQGRYQAHFVNGQRLELASSGELRLSQAADEAKTLTLWAELPLEDYVARVIDREASAQPEQAAWALAVAIRSHVLAHGQPARGCIEVDDTSAVQRVAPRPPSQGAVDAAQATAGMVLVGGYSVRGQYHLSQAKDGVLAWRSAQQQASDGLRFTDILRHAYPRATLGSASSQGVLACEQMPLVQAWLDRERVRWRQALQGEAGFSDPAQVQVCRQSGRRAHARSDTGRIDVSGFHSVEERLSIAHEYLHLAYARHPKGRDESFIENRARQLLGVLP